MSSDEDAILLLALVHRRRKRKQKRKFWVHPYFTANQEKIAFVSGRSKEIIEDPIKFQSFYRMSRDSFLVLLYKLEPLIAKQNTKFRESITPEEKLIITLRYFATGLSFKQLSFHFMRGDSTIGRIVEEVSDSIWECLREEYMPVPNEEIWIATAKRFNDLWNLPNCVVSIEGKHIRINCPAKSESAFYNYKNYFFIQLLAIADADSNFIAIDVGAYGRNGDGAVFRRSSIDGIYFKAGTLNFPQSQPLPKEPHEPTFPYYLVGDAAFPLSTHLLKPFPMRGITNQKRIFNYRLSRARRSVECAFGILVSKFKLLQGPILCSSEKTDKIVKALCILHNFIRKREGKLSKIVPLTFRALCLVDDRPKM
ncbi:putative nuclease HARBI1 [Anthonomus grandis grandis]|uniref:putative nuclease HARBI1 n=1 Tax=Anthonomus grandis grandis TaxID=2921223 RepID=UPI0021651F00|nr:putative nuclease HARBI1 [Anthonomus grandis grandis]